MRGTSGTRASARPPGRRSPGDQPAGSPSHSRIATPCWSSTGGARCAVRVDLGVVGEEPQRRAGQLAGARAWRGRRRRAAPGSSVWSQRVDLVQGAHLARPGRRSRPAAAAGRRRPSRRTRPRSAAITRSRCATRSAFVAMPGGVRVQAEAGAQPAATAPRCRPRSAPRRPGSGTARTGRWRGDGCPAARPTSPATVYRVPWKAWTPTIEASRLRADDLPAAGALPLEQRGEHPVRRRTSRRAGRRSGRRPAAGRPGPEPVSDMSPPSPWAIWS